MTAYRFMYRYAQTSTVLGPWRDLVATATHHTRAEALAIVADWNQRDQGIRVWRCMESLPGDYDYPSQEVKEPTP